MERFVVGDIEASLREAGLDIVHAFAVDARLDGLFAFPRFGREACLGLLIGNSRALWPPFTAWQATHRDLTDPLDHYVAEVVGRAVDQQRAEVIFTGRPKDGSAALPFQRLAHEIGFAALGPAHLNVQADFGPWFAFRAVAVFDAPPPAIEPARPSVEPCSRCPAPCRAPFDVAMARAKGKPERASVRADWKLWLAVRDACPVGRSYRYSDAQIGYHYTKDRRYLHEVVIGA